ncbi:MAG: alpha/beta fold hydrolase [Planctomycetota bacterium]
MYARLALLLLAALAATLLPLFGCTMMPGPSASKERVRAMGRADHLVDVRPAGAGEADQREVSAIWSDADPTSDVLVIYVHGTPGDAESWADYLDDPVGGARAVAVDRPGFGKSDSRSLADLRGQSRALAPFVQSAESVVLVGHSYGGPVVLQAALDFPDRVRGVVVIAGSVSPELEKRRWFNYLAQGVRLIVPRKLRRANDEVWVLKPDLERMAADLGRIEVPVAIVHGTEDGLVPYGNVAFMEGALTGAERVDVTTLEGVGHFLIWEQESIPKVRAAIEGVVRAAERPSDAASASTE